MPISTRVRACSHCGKPMFLVHLERDTPGYDRRTYQCPHCKTAAQFVTETETDNHREKQSSDE